MFFLVVVFGVLFVDLIYEWLFNLIIVVLVLVVGGVVMFWVECWKYVICVEYVDDMIWKDVLKIGCV